MGCPFSSTPMSLRSWFGSTSLLYLRQVPVVGENWTQVATSSPSYCSHLPVELENLMHFLVSVVVDPPEVLPLVLVSVLVLVPDVFVEVLVEVEPLEELEVGQFPIQSWFSSVGSTSVGFVVVPVLVLVLPPVLVSVLVLVLLPVEVLVLEPEVEVEPPVLEVPPALELVS